jgi:hypothetical protein
VLRIAHCSDALKRQNKLFWKVCVAHAPKKPGQSRAPVVAAEIVIAYMRATTNALPLVNMSASAAVRK